MFEYNLADMCIYAFANRLQCHKQECVDAAYLIYKKLAQQYLFLNRFRSFRNFALLQL